MRKLIFETSLFFIVAFIIIFIVFRITSNAMSETCFKPLFKDDDGIVVYDIRTGVQYWKTTNLYNYGSLTLLVDEEGKPLIYNE